MEPDFSGYATKAGLKCTDGRTIMSGAFKHQDKMQVPLVWQHGHTDPTNVLGHVLLEDKSGDVYAKAFFNSTDKAQHAKVAVEHKDINQMSIWANELLERGKSVIHGSIKEVSLVLAGANPGALIDNITIRHADGSEEDSETEAIIYTGLEFGHADDSGSGGSGDSGGSGGGKGDESIQDVIDTMDEHQQEAFHFAVSEALKAGKALALQHSDSKTDPTKGGEVKHNVFDQNGDKVVTGQQQTQTLSHDDMKSIFDNAKRLGSLKHAAEQYALAHGVENMGILFPEAKLVDGNGAPAFVTREMAWVAKVIDGTGKSPFAKVKSRSADLTFDEARAKGYIKGTMKREEFFAVSQRETGPKTIYKKQQVDRDDVIDITDFDYVAWLKAEMQVMLKEEIARAILIGDGRDVADPDKINELNIRPIAKDDPFFVVTVNVDLNNADSTVEEVHDAIIMNRQYYKGSGNPTMFTTETFIGQSMLARDLQGRKIYSDIGALKTALRVDDIIAVEVMDSEPDIAAILVNLRDYNVGTDRGGEINLFDDFDIDFNLYKYLLETRMSGALVKPKSAMVVRTTGAGAVPATATAPTWDAATSTVTIPVDANVDYVNANTGAPLADGDHVLAAGDVLSVRAVPAAGHYLTNVRVEWSYLRPSDRP